MSLCFNPTKLFLSRNLRVLIKSVWCIHRGESVSPTGGLSRDIYNVGIQFQTIHAFTYINKYFLHQRLFGITIVQSNLHPQPVLSSPAEPQGWACHNSHITPYAGIHRPLFFQLYYLNCPGKYVRWLYYQFIAPLATPLIQPLKYCNHWVCIKLSLCCQWLCKCHWLCWRVICSSSWSGWFSFGTAKAISLVVDTISSFRFRFFLLATECHLSQTISNQIFNIAICLFLDCSNSRYFFFSSKSQPLFLDWMNF